MSEATSRPAGWYVDPEDPGLKRYWTGTKWTEDRTPAIPASTVASERAVVHQEKSTTVGVLLWLFLGNLGAHRHYVGKHESAVLQPVVYIVAWILVYFGLQGDPFYTYGGVTFPMVIFWTGAILLGLNAAWVFLDVLFIAGWVDRVNGRDRTDRAKLRSDAKAPPIGYGSISGRSTSAHAVTFDRPPLVPIESVEHLPWELREDE